jgi:hypothetical protein
MGRRSYRAHGPGDICGIVNMNARWDIYLLRSKIYYEFLVRLGKESELFSYYLNKDRSLLFVCLFRHFSFL